MSAFCFYAGMAFGLFLSSVCTTENAAVQTAIAVFYPTMLLSGMLYYRQATLHNDLTLCDQRGTLVYNYAGVLWPLEGMPAWLRYISYSLPGTIPAEAMRGIMGRGTMVVYTTL